MIFDALYGLKVFYAVFVIALGAGLGWQVARLMAGTLVAHYNVWMMQRMEKAARAELLEKYPDGPPPTPTPEQVAGTAEPVKGPYL